MFENESENEIQRREIEREREKKTRKWKCHFKIELGEEKTFYAWKSVIPGFDENKYEE